MKTLLVDDERLARKELTTLLREYPQIEIIGECSNADEARDEIEKHKPDLVFLDIQMPGKNGFDLLEELHYLPQIVFVTAYDEYAIKAFEVNALDYLLKPVENKRLDETIKKMEHRISELKSQVPVGEELVGNQSKLTENDQIFLKDGEKCWFVTLKDVRMFESEGNYVRVYFGSSKPLILKSLNNLEERLDNKVFFRTNRKFIVNLRWVEHIENWFNGGLQVTLRDQTKVEVSRRQAAKFRDLMSL